MNRSSASSVSTSSTSNTVLEVAVTPLLRWHDVIFLHILSVIRVVIKAESVSRVSALVVKMRAWLSWHVCMKRAFTARLIWGAIPLHLWSCGALYECR